ncbi:unnamed protein product, partial [Brugia pahangi]|uniref:7TM_GPCR_Srx domain-containing protein n=1 Tax=Brugia pahangi TaxID=6280 RepID=A0A0N4TG70_BRUPA
LNFADRLGKTNKLSGLFPINSNQALSAAIPFQDSYSLFIAGDCSLTFNKNYSYRFSYSRSLAGKICSNTDASITVITVTSMACFDFTTLIKILAYQRRMRANTITSTSEAVRARGYKTERQIQCAFFENCKQYEQTNANVMQYF